MPRDRHVDVPAAVFDASADAYLDFVGTELGDATEDPADRAVLAAFAQLVPSGAGPVADLGCGPGRAAASVARHGLRVVGLDVSAQLLVAGRRAHPDIPFTGGRLDELPLRTGVLAGAVCWYSIIYTPPHLLGGALTEVARALAPGGVLLLAFQSGGGEAAVRADAHGTGLELTSFRHDVDVVARALEVAGFALQSTAVRPPALTHETTPQAFLIARRR